MVVSVWKTQHGDVLGKEDDGDEAKICPMGHVHCAKILSTPHG